MPRRDYSKVAFAATGDTASIPTATQPDGSVSLQQGYGFDYQRNNGAGGGTPDPLAKNIGRVEMNGILNEITASVGEIQQNGLPIYAASAAPYPINAIVRYNDLNWRSTVANNNTVPGAVGANWTPSLSQTDLHGIARFTAGGVFVVPQNVTVIYVSAVGGGGGGGGSGDNNLGNGPTGSCGAGGGAGQSVVRLPVSVTPGASLTVVVGIGGIGGTGATQGLNNATGGGSGGTTSLGGALVSLNGGSSGASGESANASGRSGPLGGSGYPNGGPGSDGAAGSSGNGWTGRGGDGGSTPFGGGGPGGKSGFGITSATNGISGFGFGSGGGGGGVVYSTGGNGRNGGAGMPGLLTIEW